jgi:hypothetical protein
MSMLVAFGSSICNSRKTRCVSGVGCHSQAAGAQLQQQQLQNCPQQSSVEERGRRRDVVFLTDTMSYILSYLSFFIYFLSYMSVYFDRAGNRKLAEQHAVL